MTNNNETARPMAARMILCSSSVRTRVPFEQAMADIGGAGFRDIDLLAINTWAHINPAVLAADYDAVTARAEAVFIKRGLTVRSMNVGFTRQLYDRSPESVGQNLRECEAVCRFMNYFGAGAAALQPLGIDPARDRGEALDDCIASLADYYECAGRYGIKLGIELHVNSHFESRDAIDRLFSKIPDAGVAYDPSHFVAQGADIRESEFIMKNSVNAHLRDSAPGDDLQTPLGAGAVDFEWIADKLAAHNYRGHYSIEYLDNEKWDALGEAVKLRGLLESLRINTR